MTFLVCFFKTSEATTKTHNEKTFRSRLPSLPKAENTKFFHNFKLNSSLLTMKTKAADLNYTRHSAAVNSGGFVTRFINTNISLDVDIESQALLTLLPALADGVSCLYYLPVCSQAMQRHIPRLAALIAARVRDSFGRGHKRTSVILFINKIYRK